MHQSDPCTCSVLGKPTTNCQHRDAMCPPKAEPMNFSSPTHPDGFTESDFELAMCVKLNLESLEALLPLLRYHGVYRIAKTQFDALVKRLTENPTHDFHR